MPYTRLKAKCVSCNLHFIVCTEHRERHNRETLHCPECGQHEGAFLTWGEEDSGEISDEVPGLAAPTPDIDVTIRDIPLDDLIP